MVISTEGLLYAVLSKHPYIPCILLSNLANNSSREQNFIPIVQMWCVQGTTLSKQCRQHAGHSPEFNITSHTVVTSGHPANSPELESCVKSVEHLESWETPTVFHG